MSNVFQPEWFQPPPKRHLPSTPSQPVRYFDGSDDFLTLALGDIPNFVNSSLIAVVRRETATDEDDIFTIGSPLRHLLYVASNNNLSSYNGTTSSSSLTAIVPDDGFMLVGVTRTTGTVAPRFHLYSPRRGWTHTNGSANQANPSAPATSAFIGNNGSGFWFRGWIGGIGLWDEVLDDTAFEGLDPSLQGWLDAGAHNLWRLADTTVNDYVGTADQSAITGTVVENKSCWFDLTIPVAGAQGRQFDGTDDHIVTDQGSVPGQLEEVSTAVWVKFDSFSGDPSLLAVSDGTADEWSLYVDGFGKPTVWNGANSVFSTSTLTTGRWYLLGFSKAAGTSTPRFHWYDYTASAWTHEDANFTIVPNDAPTAPSIYHGIYADATTEPLAGEMVASAVWANELADATYETFEADLQSWADEGPVALWRYGDDPLEDLIGAAEESSRTGGVILATTLDVDIAVTVGAAEQIAPTGTITPDGALTNRRSSTRTLEGTVTPAGTVTLVKALKLAVGGTITPSGTLTFKVTRTFEGTITPAGTLATAAIKAIAPAGTVTPAGELTLVKSLHVTLAGTATPAGELSFLKNLHLSLGGTITPAGELTTDTGGAPLLSADGVLGLSGELTLVKSLHATFSGTLTPSGELSSEFSEGAPTLAVEGLVTPSGTVAFVKTLTVSLGGTITPDGSLTVTFSEGPSLPPLEGTLGPAGSLSLRASLHRTYSGSITPTGRVCFAIPLVPLDPGTLTLDPLAQITVTLGELADLTGEFPGPDEYPGSDEFPSSSLLLSEFVVLDQEDVDLTLMDEEDLSLTPITGPCY